ncbi:MAG: CHAT domain-containing protein [Acidobacteria bacterium]|nr:CHAT domain-containing protein [Acidobacteriota bacterium]
MSLSLLLLLGSDATARAFSVLVARYPLPGAKLLRQETENQGPGTKDQGPTEVRELVPGVPIERELAGGETHTYRITLASGQCLHVVIDQQGIEVVVTLFEPDSQKITKVWSMGRMEEPMPVYLVAEKSGEHRLEVSPHEAKAPPARYRIRIEDVRDTTQQDKKRFAAERIFEEGRQGRIQGTAESLRKANEKFEEALTLWRAVGFRAGETGTLNNLGIVNYSLGENQKALEYWGQLLLFRRAEGNRGAEADTLDNIGLVYYYMGEYQRALDCFSQALSVWRAMGSRWAESYSLNSIGGTYYALGQYEKSLDYHNQALQLRRALGDRFGEAGTLNLMGRVHLSVGEKEKALEYYEQALRLGRAIGNRVREADALRGIGKVHQGLGEVQKALEYYDQALPLARARGDRRGEASTLTSIGEAYYSLGEYEKALSYYGEALPLCRAMADRSVEAVALAGIARVERARGNLTEARAQIEAALTIIESLRSSVASQELRTSYFASKGNHYGFYTDLLMRLHQRQPSAGHEAVALQASERARARSLLETLAEARANIGQSVDPSLLERERTLQQQLNAKEQRRMQLLSGKHTEEQATVAEKEVRELLTQYQEVQAQIRVKSPRYAALTQPQPLSLREIQQQVLDDDTLLLEYALGEGRSFLWAVTPSSITSYELPKRKEIEDAAQRVYNMFLTEEDVIKPEPVLALSRMLLGPVADQLGKKRLVIVADGALQYLPFAALPAPGVRSQKSEVRSETPHHASRITHHELLIVDHEIIALPSASVLVVLRKELAGRAPAAKRVAVLADPVFQNDDLRVKTRDPRLKTQDHSSNPQSTIRNPQSEEPAVLRSGRETGMLRFDRLPLSRIEANEIAALAPKGQQLKALDFQANRATATSPELSRYRIVHFATHGLLNNVHPELSGVVLSLVDEQGQPQDGFLRLHEIYNLSLGADLVVLSACQTALGKEMKGEGLVGLSRGFMYAGAPRVVASLWKVDDEATAELMKRFYRGMLKESLRPAPALRAAQISMRQVKRWRSPRFWAGFVLQGEWQ